MRASIRQTTNVGGWVESVLLAWRMPLMVRTLVRLIRIGALGD